MNAERKKLKYVATVNDDILPETTDPERELLYVDISDLDSTGKIRDGDIMRFENTPSRARRLVRDGDVIVSTVRTYLRAIAPITEPGPDLVVSTGFAVIRPRDELHPRYTSYALQDSTFVNQVVAHSEGVSYPAISPSKLQCILVPVPPKPMQLAVADYLDSETARIDTLIGRKQHFIDLLLEKRTALITHAVTKGLDPDVEMKDSRIEWFGLMPKHWRVVRLKDLARSIQTGPFGTQLGADDYIQGGIPVINPAHIVGDRIAPDESVTVDEAAANRLGHYLVSRGDIVCARRGQLGRCAVVADTNDGWVTGTGSLRVRPHPAKAVPSFIQLLISQQGSRDWLKLQSVGSTMDNLNEGILSRLPVAAPDIAEQRDIIAHMERDVAKVDALVSRTCKSMDLLSEYRTALISVAVTGQIDIPGTDKDVA